MLKDQISSNNNILIHNLEEATRSITNRDQIVSVIDDLEWPGLSYTSDEKVFTQLIEKVINHTLQGLTMYVRDVNLPAELVNKYDRGMIIKERIFVDASRRVQGMITTHRYAILSNHMVSFEALEEDRNWGLHVANRESRFMVLDVHEYRGKTFIILLHLPDGEDWKMFQTIGIGNLKEELIASSIERLENICDFEAAPELSTDMWLDRCKIPLGIDSKGNFYDINEKLIFLSEHEWAIIDTRTVLKEHPEWRERYAKYAAKIIENEPFIRTMRSRFREWSPLKLYFNVSSALLAKRRVFFSLRYLGQAVADLIGHEEKIMLSTKGYDEKNLRDFDCSIQLNNALWKEKSAGEFRSHFKNRPAIRNKNQRNNDEHRIESLLLSEFSKTKEKMIRNIRPVEIAGVRLQIPTPLKASAKGVVEYASNNGGGIDILARVGTSGHNTRLCVIELKDENTKKEPAEKVLAQALKYSVFIRELLRSDAGTEWYKLFGFSGNVPDKLVIYAVCAMPDINGADISFAGRGYDIEGDVIELHYLYFKETGNKLERVRSSLPIDTGSSNFLINGVFTVQDAQTGLWGAKNIKGEWVILPIHDSEETLRKVEYI